MKPRSRRTWMILLAMLIGLGCTRPLKFNDKKIRNKCDIADAVELTPDQALCVGRLAGLKDKRNCPLEVHEGADVAGVGRRPIAFAYALRDVGDAGCGPRLVAARRVIYHRLDVNSLGTTDVTSRDSTECVKVMVLRIGGVQMK